ncbi:hypothetical protein ATOBIA_N01100 [Atopobiaceae bacterium P1]|uniref:Uncharacterized protein n=1 Tax=Leptogranulimonas caecicola TaxID=2894156 RepID=A0AAU9C223_9ACTN|nr:hypothetical protein ATOBIA_N01100 [Atopobiaceae bacterium P1]BDC90240.1 hypothetical protein ATTO_01120 [Leptogranulimonas caecicola]
MQYLFGRQAVGDFDGHGVSLRGFSVSFRRTPILAVRTRGELGSGERAELNCRMGGALLICRIGARRVAVLVR